MVNWWGRRSAAAGVPSDAPAVAEFAVGRESIDPALFGFSSWSDANLLSAPISRREALSVPAVKRARDLVAGVIGTLPVHQHGPDKSQSSSVLLDQPEDGIPRSVTMARTIEDMLFYDRAYWIVTESNYLGFPTKVRRVDPLQVEERDGMPGVYFESKYYPRVIRFHGPTGDGGLLRTAARAIRTCVKLESTAAMYADEPLGQAYFSPKEGAIFTADSIKNALNAWKAARQARATGFVPDGLLLNQLQAMTPEQLQLADSRQHAVLEIARATGVSPERLGVSTTSRTYANIEQERLEFVDFTLMPFAKAVEERLSMGDVTPRGSYVRFAFSGFLRTDTASRYAAYEVGLRVGALAPDEIRQLEDKPPLTDSQKPKPAAVTPPIPVDPKKGLPQ